MSGRLVLAFALAACSPQVNVGSDLALNQDTVCDEVTAAPVACPDAPWGPRVSIASAESFERQLIGRWAFCGGEKRYSGRGGLVGFAQGTGIEFWSEAGQLRYAFLRGDRRNDLSTSSGTVRLLVEGGRGRAVLHSGDGHEAVWHTDFFEGQPVLQNGAFDVWNFVAIE